MTSEGWATEITWVIEGELAAFAAFALSDLDHLEQMGIGAIVSLTEELPHELRGSSRFEVLHLPVVDMTPPEVAQIREYVAFVDRNIAAGRAVGTHCLAGLGRTGTMIACSLVSRGRSADDAIAEVRRARPGSIQTEMQERAVHRWAMISSGEWDIAEFL